MEKVKGCAVYEAPYIEFCEVAVEQGISVSGGHNISGVYNEEIGGRDTEESW